MLVLCLERLDLIVLTRDICEVHIWNLDKIFAFSIKLSFVGALMYCLTRRRYSVWFIFARAYPMILVFFGRIGMHSLPREKTVKYRRQERLLSLHPSGVSIAIRISSF